MSAVRFLDLSVTTLAWMAGTTRDGSKYGRLDSHFLLGPDSTALHATDIRGLADETSEPHLDRAREYLPKMILSGGALAWAFKKPAPVVVVSDRERYSSGAGARRRRAHSVLRRSLP